jgi:hypothetical protein
MFLARAIFFKLYESPKFLVTNDRAEEALMCLKKISHFNGEHMRLTLIDVRDKILDYPTEDEESRLQYSAVTEENVMISETPISTAKTLSEDESPLWNSSSEAPQPELSSLLPDRTTTVTALRRNSRRMGSSSALLQPGRNKFSRTNFFKNLPDRVTELAEDYGKRIEMLFDRKWKRITILGELAVSKVRIQGLIRIYTLHSLVWAVWMFVRLQSQGFERLD